MTAVLTEAATAGRAAGAAEGASASRAAAARRSPASRRPASRQPVTFRGPRPLPEPRAPRRPRTARPSSPAGGAAFDFYKRQATASRGGELTDYQPIILAEFVAAVLLVALTPVAGSQKKHLSPYASKDMIQLVAVTVTYLILALISTGPRQAGRVSAWLGGLILLGIGLVETTTIARTLDLFGLGGPPPAGVEAGGQNLAGIVNQGIVKDTTGTAGG